ncbi:MAG: GNAT family N-acetyltransferase [bacterium]|nr:GNAT family N-acetyltransferase [bacterium]
MIEKATLNDLKEILDLQHYAYITEANRFNNMNIEPLTETLDDLKKEYEKGIVLKMVIDNKIIGSVRGYTENNTLHINKLMVHQSYRGNGYGKELIKAIEELYQNKRYELFTSTRSIENINMYQELGYKIFKYKKIDDELEFVYLEKK